MERPRTDNDMLAIVGIGCRFPGNVVDPETFWTLMAEGRDGIVEIPPGRMDLDKYYDDRTDAPGKIYVRHGGFLQQRIDEFDAQFFGMSPREAAYLDPQQRLLLEVTFEALENAGIPAEALAGSRTGVFIGGFMVDGMLTQFSPLNRRKIGQHTAVSSTLTILSNRLSYVLDLHGPSMTMDTACSSSLVAMHQACQALRAGDCSMALVGGVNVIFRPETLIAMCKGGFLSKDGRSKSFDARADGYGRGEGAGIVVLKPYAAALADNDRIYALVRGSGVNQDGRTDGITVPSSGAQEALIRQVCANSDTPAETIRFVEAHGTGTAIGDPIEIAAIGAALGTPNKDKPSRLVGSVKANIGHLEAAAGIAGVIKTALCLLKQQVPPVANLQTLNPAIDFKGLGLSVPRKVEPLQDDTTPMRAAVNSFGYGGTNAHVILEQLPHQPRGQRMASAAGQASLLVLSARQPAALKALANAYVKLLSTPNAPALADVAYSAAVRRSHFEHKLAVLAPDSQAAVRALEDYGTGADAAALATGAGSRSARDPVFVFSGMGPQWWGMGRELYEHYSVFRNFADNADQIFRRLAGWSIVTEMLKPESESIMAETHIAQPANFILQGGLAEVWKSWGIRPAAIVGHSVGEVSAAYVGGILSLGDAVRVAYYRSMLQKRMAGRGGMLAVGATQTDLEPLIQAHTKQLSFAALNGPSSITLSGDVATLRTVAAELTARGIFNRQLKVEMAYHSPMMDPILDELTQSLEGISLSEPTVPVFSTVSGQICRSRDFGHSYWRKNVRDPVYFARAISELIARGHDLFLEIGPHPVLSGAVRECLQAANVEGTVVSSLRRGSDESATLLRHMADLYVAGARIDWNTFYGQAGAHFVDLPTYPWQREVHWSEAVGANTDRVGAGAEHAFLGRRVPTPGAVWESSVNLGNPKYLADHKVHGRIVLPGAAYVEIALALATRLIGGQGASVCDLSFSQALLIDDHDEPVIHTSFDEASRTFSIHSRAIDDDGEWIKHADGTISLLPVESAEPVSIEAWKASCRQPIDVATHYAQMSERGLDYGPAFRGISALALSDDRSQVLAQIGYPGVLSPEQESHLHPALLDACFQTLIATVSMADASQAFLPVRIGEVRIHAPLPEKFWCHGARTRLDGRELWGDLLLADESGKVLAEIRDVRALALGRGAADIPASQADLLYRFNWEDQSLPRQETERQPRSWLILADTSGMGASLARVLADSSDHVTLASTGDRLTKEKKGWSFRADVAEDLDAILAECSHDGIIDLRGLDPISEDDPVGLRPLLGQLALWQAVTRSGQTPNVTIVLPDGSATAAKPQLSAAPSLGFARVAANEHTDIRVKMIRLGASKDRADLLADELLHGGDEDDVSLSAEARKVLRLGRVGPDALAAEAALQRPAGRPTSGEIDVTVDAMASPTPSGKTKDIVGTVVSVGENVDGVHVGDRVIARLSKSAGLVVRLAAAAALRLPPALGVVDETLLLPLALTHHALVRAGSLKAADKVLIYPADGLAGQIAIAITQATGALPIALDRVADGGTVRTSIDRLYTEHPEGIDLLFTAADDEVTTHLHALLALCGRHVSFCDTSANTAVAPVRPNQTLSRIEAVALVQEARITLQPSLDAAVDLIGGWEEALDRIVGTARRERHLVDFRQQADEHQAALIHSVEPAIIDAQGSYLITGGFGGFGVEIAKWLIERGARHLVLVGRSGAQTPQGRAIVDELTRLGGQITPYAADIADPQQVRDLLASIAAGEAPLRGVFHAAAVLDDGPIYTLLPDQVTRVMRPKAIGAWNLHEQTADLPLTCFVMLSSIASLIGSPGQGTYVAANAFLDALAWHRRSLGLPANSINLGALAEVGMAARHEGVERHLARVGVGSLAPREALDMIGRIVAWNPVAMAAARMDWSLWGSAYTAWAKSPAYRHLMPDTENEGAAHTDLAHLQPAERQEVVNSVVIGLVAEILRLSSDAIDRNRSLLNMGIDSLMAMELQAGIDRRLDVKIPTLELMKGITFDNLLRKLSDLIAESATSEQQAPADAVLLAEKQDVTLAAGIDLADVGNIISKLDQLSDDEVERAIAQLSEQEVGRV